MPLEIQSHTVPHLKALISGNLEPRGLRWGSTFRVCQALFKSAVLLHKEAYRADLFASECKETCKINNMGNGGMQNAHVSIREEYTQAKKYPGKSLCM